MKRNVLSIMMAGGLFAMTIFTLYAGTVKEERKVKAYEGVSVALSADVELRQGSETKVVLEGPADFLEKVETVVEGGILKIRFYDRYNNRRKPSGRISIYLTTSVVKALVVTGSARINAVTPIDAGSVMKTLVTGSGKIVIDRLTAEEVKASVTGSGTIRLSGGGAEKEYVSITGSGDVYTGKLPAKEVIVSITGSGDAHVYAGEYLKVHITGSGDVFYRGDGMIDARITGSGDVRKE